MRTWIRLLVLCAVVSAAGAVEVETTVSAGTAVTSNYLWRGFNIGPAGLFNEGALSAVIDGRTSLTAYVWNYTKIDGGWRTGEFDYDLSISHTPEGVPAAFTVGWLYYDIASFLGVDTQEVYFGVDVDVIGQPFVYAFYDYDAAVGLYLLFGAGHTFDLAPRLGLDLSGSIGLDTGRGIDAFNDADLSAGLNYALTDEWSLAATVDLVVPSHQVALYGARLVPAVGVSYGKTF